MGPRDGGIAPLCDESRPGASGRSSRSLALSIPAESSAGAYPFGRTAIEHVAGTFPSPRILLARTCRHTGLSAIKGRSLPLGREHGLPHNMFPGHPDRQFGPNAGLSASSDLGNQGELRSHAGAVSAPQKGIAGGTVVVLGVGSGVFATATALVQNWFEFPSPEVQSKAELLGFHARRQMRHRLPDHRCMQDDFSTVRAWGGAGTSKHFGVHGRRIT